MNSESASGPRKFHLSLNVHDLVKSTAFFKTMLGASPAKTMPDFVKFELDDPGLVLSLQPSPGSIGGTLNHAGLRLPGSGELLEAQQRMEAAGFTTSREDGVECCHARQTKFWVNDPDQTMWELYLFHEDVENLRTSPPPIPVPGEDIKAAFAKDVPRTKIRWTHRLPDPFPASIPLDGNIADEIHMEGTFNASAAKTELPAFLRLALSALRPGGVIHLHGLAGDGRLAVPLPPLPGPAAVVEHVPALWEPLRAVRDAGFVSVEIEKLSSEAFFRVEGVALREVIIAARKPGYRPKKRGHSAVYLGPLAMVKDDFGNVFKRGKRVALNVHDWQVLSIGPAAAQFQFFKESDFAPPDRSCASL